MLLSINMTKWSTQDIVYTTANASSNWYTDSRSLRVTFTPPAGSGLSNIVTKGFWDGGSTFKVRFTPTVTGTWTYGTTGSTITDLTNQTEAGGSQIVVGAPEAGDHGFLRIDPAHTTTFVWDDGARYFMEGQTYYSLMQSAMVNDNWKTAVDNSLAYGMNKARMFVYAQGGFTGAGETASSHGYPNVTPYAGAWNSPNRDALNFPYWQKLDEVVQYMEAHGMVADLIVTNFYRNGYMAGTDAQNDRFLNYVINRYAAYDNVIWCLANEWEVGNQGTYPQDQNDYDRFGAIFRNTDPWMAQGTALRPLSIHNMTTTSFQFFGSSWPTYAMQQYKTQDDQQANAGILLNITHNMPSVNDEYKYIAEGTRTQLRRTAWGIATAGGYSSMGDYRLLGSGTTWYPCRTGEWADAPGEYGDVDKLVDFFTAEGIEYWKMTSHNELKSGSTRDYVLAEPGRQYVLYTGIGDAAAGINLSGYSGNFNVLMYDPTSGAMTRLADAAGGATHTWNLTGANASGGADWVLLVTALDVSGLAPAVPAALAASVISTSRIDLSWTDNSGSETGYEIDRATDSAFSSSLTTFTVASNVTTFQSTGLTSGTTYYYRVRATMGGTNDSANSNTAGATAGAIPPAAPTGLSATAASTSQINLTWSDNSTDETGFEIDLATDIGFTVGLTTVSVAANINTYQSTGLSGSTTYYYRVRATIGGSNDSANSNVAGATTFSPPVQLLSDYTFDTATGGQVVAGASAGNVEMGASVGAGLIGAGSLYTQSNSQFFRMASPYPAMGSAAAVGTESIWFKLSKNATSVFMLYGGGNGTDNVNHGIYGYFDGDNGNRLGWYQKAHNGTVKQEFDINKVDGAWNDGGTAWHNLTVTYNLNGPGSSTAVMYLDGVDWGAAISTTKTGIDATNPGLGAYTRFGVASDNGGGSPDLVGYAGYGWRDDFAIWGTQLSAVQAAALYNLGITGVAGTRYNAKDATALFNAFSTGAGVTTSDGKTWTHVASGLSGAAGTVGANYLVLDSGGGGMVLGAPVDVTWTGTGGSTWSTSPGSGNWKKTSDGTVAEYFSGVDVLFNDTATGTSVTISAADVTPAGVTFSNSSKDFTVGGAKGIAGAGTTLTKQGTATVTIGSVNSYGGTTTVEAGRLVLQGNAKAMVPVLSGGGVNLKGGLLVLDYAGESDPAATVRSLLAASYAGWGGSHFNTGKFQSTTADATHSLGWVDNTTTGNISIAYTIYGDADLDGSVGLSDLGKVLTNWGTGSRWQDGDVDYDGVVSLSDLGKVLTNWGLSVGTLHPAAGGGDVIPVSTEPTVTLNAVAAPISPPNYAIFDVPVVTRAPTLRPATVHISTLAPNPRAKLDDKAVTVPPVQGLNIVSTWDTLFGQWALRTNAEIHWQSAPPVAQVVADLSPNSSDSALARQKVAAAAAVQTETLSWVTGFDGAVSPAASDAILSSEDPERRVEDFGPTSNLDWVGSPDTTPSSHAIDDSVWG